MPPIKEQQRKTQSVAHDMPDLAALMKASLISADNYTCKVCGQSGMNEVHFRLHAWEEHKARNKGPMMNKG